MNIKTWLWLGMLLASNSVAAIEFNHVLPNESSVKFGYKQMGVPMEGKFNQFAAQLVFDPAKLSSAKARFDIALASIDAGSTEANDEVAGKLWFNAKAFPTASFVASNIKSLGGNRYEATGKLTIKGITQTVTAPVTFQAQGTSGSFDGVFTIKRLDYKIGEGEWTDISTVANEIQIKFHVVVSAASHKK